MQISRFTHFHRLCRLGFAGLLFCQPLLASQDLSSLSFHPALLTDERTSLNDGKSFSQPQDAGDQVIAVSNSAGIDRFDLDIEALMHNSGPYSPGLAQLLQDKGRLLQQQGLHEQALQTLEQGLHVLRVNFGLNNAQQFAILRRMIDSKLALRDIQGADDLQASLFRLQLEHYGEQSREACNAYIEWADWNVGLYLKEGGRLVRDLSDPEQLNLRLTEAYNQYTSALLLLHQSDADNTGVMIATERKLAAISFIVKQYMGDEQQTFMSAVDHDFAVDQQARARQRADMTLFKNGKSALQRAIAYSASQDSPDYISIAERMMELGDWYLLFDHRSAAVDVYEEVLALLNSVDADEQAAQRVLMAGLPVQTPDNAYRQSGPVQYAGYFDVEFSLNKFGKASDLQILSSVGGDRAIEKALLRTIRSGKFRPGFDKGSVSGLGKMQLRYYYTL